MADDVITIFLSLYSGYVFVTLSLSQNDIITFMEELKDFRLFGEPSGLKQLVSKQKRLIYVLYSYGIIGGLMYVVACYLLSSHCRSLNKVYAKTCGLPFPLLLPFEVDLNVKLFIIIIQMIVALYQVFLPMITIASVLAAIMENMQLRLKHVREAVASIAMADTFEERRNLLKFCFKYYNNVLRFEKLQEKYMGKSTALHVFLPGLIMGTLNYIIYYDMQTKDILTLIPWITMVWFFCHAGQGLLDESAKLSTEMYNLPWYDFEPVLQRSIILFLIRSQKPVKVKVGFFYVFSYELLLKIVKSSFSFMTLLNQLSNLSNKE